MKNSLLNKVLLFLIFLGVGFICYVNTIKSPFIWDDEVTVVNNPLIRSWRYLPELLRTSIFGEKLKGISYYRPVQNFSYLLDYHIWKLNVAGYHIVNILLHIINAYLFFIILELIFKNFGSNFKSVPLIVSLLFLIHPVNTEAVTYISGRGDLLAAFFSLISFLFFLRRNSYFLIILFFILSLFSKESSVVLSGIIFIYYFLFLKEKDRKNQKNISIILLVISVVYILLKMKSIHNSNIGTLSLINEASLKERIFTLPRVLITYIRLLIFPVNLHMEYHFVEKSLSSPYVILGIPFLILLFYVFYRVIKPFSIFVFFTFWFLFALSPFYNIIFPLHATLLEHWLYLSSIGFITLIVLFFKNILKGTPFIKNLILTSFILFFIIFTIKRNKDWQEPIRLYSHDLKYEKNSFLLWNNLGVEFYRRGLIDKAKYCFLNSIKVSPNQRYGVAFNNIGVIYKNEGNLDEAIKMYKKSIKVNNYVLAYKNLGRVLIEQGNLKESLKVLKKGISIYPYDVELKKMLERYKGLTN